MPRKIPFKGNDRRILRHKTAMQLMDVGPTRFYDILKNDPTFPPSVVLGKRGRGIFSDELQSWMDALPRERCGEVA